VVKELLDHPDRRPGMNILIDSQETPLPKDMTFKYISKLRKTEIEGEDKELGPCRWATLVGDVFSYSKIHQFIITGRLSTTPVERKPFRDMQEAKKWLGVPDDYEIKWPDGG